MSNPNEQLDAVIEPPPPPPPASPPVMTMRRDMLNYVTVAVVFLALGFVIGAASLDRLRGDSAANTDALIQRAVATAVAAVPQGAAAPAVPSGPINVNIEGAPAIGSPDAPIVMVEFGDFQCSFCQRFFTSTLDPLLEQYGDQIYFVYRDFPVLGPASLDAALAAACAHEQQRFWEYHDILYQTQAFARDSLISHAQTLQLDVERFTVCFDEQTYRDSVIADYLEGQSYGVGGTPTFFINGRIFVGAQPLEQFQLAIESELAAIAATEDAG